MCSKLRGWSCWSKITAVRAGDRVSFGGWEKATDKLITQQAPCLVAALHCGPLWLMSVWPVVYRSKYNTKWTWKSMLISDTFYFTINEQGTCTLNWSSQRADFWISNFACCKYVNVINGRPQLLWIRRNLHMDPLNAPDIEMIRFFIEIFDSFRHKNCTLMCLFHLFCLLLITAVNPVHWKVDRNS